MKQILFAAMLTAVVLSACTQKDNQPQTEENMQKSYDQQGGASIELELT